MIGSTILALGLGIVTLGDPQSRVAADAQIVPAVATDSAVVTQVQYRRPYRSYYRPYRYNYNYGNYPRYQSYYRPYVSAHHYHPPYRLRERVLRCRVSARQLMLAETHTRRHSDGQGKG